MLQINYLNFSRLPFKGAAVLRKQATGDYTLMGAASSDKHNYQSTQSGVRKNNKSLNTVTAQAALLLKCGGVVRPEQLFKTLDNLWMIVR
jgi:hypothetical protein